MGKWLTIARRELKMYFNSPIAYCFIVVFLLVTCGLYMTTFFLSGIASMRSFFSSLPLILIVFVPSITMRLWAEERKNGTISLLFSLPTKSVSLVMGKFFGALLFAATALASTLTIPFMLAVLGDPDFGPIIGGYIGGLLLMAMLLAMGMMISAFFTDQIVAFIISLVVGFTCFLLGIDLISSFLDGWIPNFGTFLRETIAIPSHFNSFAKGVVDVSDVIYFASFTLAFLIINNLTLDGRLRMKTAKGFGVGCLLLVGIAVFANGILRGMHLGRFDLTENKLFTVSPGTKRVFQRLQVPITVTYYVSSKNKLPTPMKDIERDVTDILEELRQISTKFSYQVIHPEDIPDQIEVLSKKGISPFSAQTIEQDALNIKRIYSSISVAYLDKKEEVIPQVVPDSLGSLEYDLVSRIYRLTLASKPKVLLLTPSSAIDPRLAMMLKQAGRPIPPEQDRFMRLTELLESQGYEVKKQHKITKDAPIPKGTRSIAIIAPEKLSERERYEIYRFLRSGGPVFLATQMYTYSYTEGPNGQEVHAQKTMQGANEIINPFGISLLDKMFFDQRHLTLHVTSQRQVGMFTAVVQTPVNYPMQIQILPDQMNQALSVTNSLSGLLYLWGSPLDIDRETVKGAGLKVTPLFTSSQMAWTRDFHLGPLSEADFTPPPSKDLRSYPLAVLLEGQFPDPFEGKEVPKWSEGGKDANETEIVQKSTQGEGPIQPKSSKLMVVGSSEMFSDSAIMALGNPVFFLNAMDALSLGEELIHIRNKTQIQHFIAPVGTQEKLLWRFFTVFLVPGLWILFGVSRAYRRRARRAQCTT